MSRLRHDKDHQALMLLRVGDGQACIFDGLHSAALLDPALAAYTCLADVMQIPQDSRKPPDFAACPKQYDSWSCGHRILLHMKFILESDAILQDPLGAVTIPDKATRNSVISKLCKDKTATKLETSLSHLKFVKKEKTSTSHKADPECRGSPSEELMLPTTGSSGKVPVKTKAESEANACPPTPKAKRESIPAEQNGKLSTPPRPEKPASKFRSKEPVGAEKDPKLEPDYQNEMVAMAQKILARRQEKKIRKKAQSCGKSALYKRGVTHNDIFQKLHAGISLAGHWQAFVEAVGGMGHIDCAICESIVIKYNVPVRDGVSDDEKEEAAQCSPEPEQVDDNIDEDQDKSPKVQATRKRGRPGRPRKGEKASFDLKEFMAEERANIYSWLTADDLHAECNGDEEKIAKALAKNPCFCRPCNCRINFCYLTNDRALQSHENSKEHKARLAAMDANGGVPDKQEEKCTGVLISSGPGAKTPLGSICERVVDWKLLDCPSILNSMMNSIQVDARLQLSSID